MRGLVCFMLALAGGARGGPSVEPWAGSADAVAAARLAGWYASSDRATDTVEIRNVGGDLVRTIARAEILDLAPWMTLDASPDGVSALAWTDSGRSLFIVVTDSSAAPDGLGSDVVLRYDSTTGGLSRFARAEVGVGGPLGAAHFRGRLSVATEAGAVRVYRAERNDEVGVLDHAWTPAGGAAVRGMAIARPLDAMFLVTETMLYRVDLAAPAPAAVAVGAVTRGRAVAFSDHYGAAEHQGVFVAEGEGGGADARLLHVPLLQATGLLAYAPVGYLTSEDDLASVAATACGRLLLSGAGQAWVVRDDTDTRLSYEAWLADEFAQVVAFGAGLVSPGGEPAGWVIDAGVTAGTPFHPATPDAAAWVVLLHIARDHIADDRASADLVRAVLVRYAGQAGDGIGPSVSADGMMRHWIDPATGGAMPGWDPEYATLSTMKIVLAADRARRFYAGDEAIEAAASAIIDRVSNWGGYIEPGTEALYFVAEPAGGPRAGTQSSPFHEGIMFIEQAARMGGAESSLAHWLDRSVLPSAEFVDGLPLSTGADGVFQPAFVSLYPALLQRSVREETAWREQVRALQASNGAWTDDAGPRLMTVFSAGTTKPAWGGYHADTLDDHPGAVTTLPSLLAFGAYGETAASVGAYHAYRHGARQTFVGGASILWRRSEVDPSYRPPDAGLPDVALGGLGLAELLREGTIDAVLATPYRGACAADLTDPAGVLDFFDVAAFLSAFSARGPEADFAPPFGVWDFFDVSAYLSHFSEGCP